MSARKLGQFVSWHGGARPVQPDVFVTVIRRDGFCFHGRAGQWSWLHDKAPDGCDPEDITAYTVREPRPRSVVTLR